MKISSSDILALSQDLNDLSSLLNNALSRDEDGLIRVTPSEADKICEKIILLSKEIQSRMK